MRPHPVEYDKCPFCGEGEIKIIVTPAHPENRTSRGSGQGSTQIVQVDEKRLVLTDCPNCGKKASSIKRAFYEKKIPKQQF